MKSLRLPAEMKRDWITADGKVRLEVSPRGDVRDNAVLLHLLQRCARLPRTQLGLR